jgi:hypothetical protein
MKQNRGILLGALLTLARAWVANGKPAPKVKPLGSFESWTTVVGGILENAGIDGFLANSAELYAKSDDETPAWEGLLSQIDEIFSGKPFLTSMLVEKMKLPQHSDLRESLDIIFGDATNHEATLKQQITKGFKARVDKRFGIDGGSQFWLQDNGTRQRLARFVVRSNQNLKIRTMPKRFTKKEVDETAAA